MRKFSFSLFLPDIKYTIIFKDEALTAPSSPFFTKNSCGNWGDDGAVSASSLSIVVSISDKGTIYVPLSGIEVGGEALYFFKTKVELK